MERIGKIRAPVAYTVSQNAPSAKLPPILTAARVPAGSLAGMTFQIFLVLALLATAIVVFAFEWLSVDVATLILLSILVLSGIIDVKEAFAGFSNEIVVILAAIFVLSDALMRTGVIDQAGQAIHRLAGGSEMRIVLCVMLVTAFISAFMNNTTTTAVVLPAALGVCRKSGVA